MKSVQLVIVVLLLIAHAQQPSPPPSSDIVAGTERVDTRDLSQVWVPAGAFIAGSTQEQVDDAYLNKLSGWNSVSYQTGLSSIRLLSSY